MLRPYSRAEEGDGMNGIHRMLLNRRLQNK